LSGEFEIKDSGKRQEFSGGMVRDTTEGKTNFLNVLFGPMLDRWAEHMTKGREKYPDPEPGVPNWTLAEGMDEYLRAKESAMRHMLQYLRGDTDEDHAAAVFFNLNLAEYAKAKLKTDEAPKCEDYTAAWNPSPGYEERWHPVHLANNYCIVGCPGCDRERA
jgi:hypothetical protein